MIKPILTLLLLSVIPFSNTLLAFETSNRNEQNNEPSFAEVSSFNNTHTETPEASTSYIDNTQTNCGHEPVGLIFDNTFSAIVGAEATIAVYRGYELLDDWIAPSTAGDTSGSMIAGRSGKALFELLLSMTARVTQHEIFGHGARAREFNLPAHYSVGIFTGSTYFNANKYNQLSFSEQLAFIAGGMEGTSILDRQLRARWIRSQTIDSREASLYFATSYLDETQYIYSTRGFNDKTFRNGHDVLTYVNTLNQWNPNHPLTLHRLRRQNLVNLLDPYLYYSMYSIGLYVVNGCQLWEYPMIPIGEYRYLPMMRLLLSPYGPEYQWVNLIKTPERTIIATLRYGNTGAQRSSALALDISDLLSVNSLFIDGKVECWNQPKLYTSTANGRTKFGAAASLVARYRLMSQFDIVGQAGYKTTGFMPGEVLKHAPILRIGFLLNI